MSTNTPNVNDAPKKKRTPQQLAEFHREQARKNDARYAEAANADVALASKIIRDIAKLGANVPDALIQGAASDMEAVRSKLVEETLAERDGAR